MKLTPMMSQYMKIKKEYEDCILFFRLGDFYEMFFEDAKTASRELEITLTGKNCGQEERAPMCGVPYHAAEAYIEKLIAKGYKVAICEQTEDPETAKGIVEREVIQVITPGTLLSRRMLNENENNYIASVYMDERGAGIVYSDVSTGEIVGVDFLEEDINENVLNLLTSIKVREIIINESALIQEERGYIKNFTGAYVSPLGDSYFSKENCNEIIKKHFSTGSLMGMGIAERPYITSALGALLEYLYETQKNSMSQLINFSIYEQSNHMSIDKATIRNIELLETLYENKVSGSLLGVLDKTGTAMGSRLMRNWIRSPLTDLDMIKARLDAVEYLFDDIVFRNHISETLKKIYDLERLATRMACGNANGRDMIALKNSLFNLPEIKIILKETNNTLLNEISNNIDPLEEIYKLIENSIVDDPPFTIKEGGLIKEGYSSKLDEMKNSIADGQNWIASLESIERERTGIKTLKVGFNKVFGYYIEVRKSGSDLIPDNYIRKQTLVNCERYITPELKEVESKVLNAEAKINSLEHELFSEIRERIKSITDILQKTAKNVAALDVLTSYAHVSQKLGFVKPDVHSGEIIAIKNGRHPVIENMVSGGTFVANDTYIDNEDASMLLITGPNMAGKSTYMRQTALIVLMAHMGCFVPCDEAEIGLVDRIYTRIGASDNLSQGQSTFFVEMSELAYILNTCTSKSLIILDEIGRGTSTYDGLSIAWALVEHLCKDENRARTMFATHYHELTVLSDTLKGIKNLNVEVRQDNGKIVFMHKIVEGSASQSYGIHVADLAGVPKSLLLNAQDKLKMLEESAGERDISKVEKSDDSDDKQISFFDIVPNPAIEMIKNLNLFDITPSKAIEILEELKKIVSSK